MRNRATVFRQFLELKNQVNNPALASIAKELDLTMYEAAALGQLVSAAEGNTSAWKEIQDTLFGKLTEKTELTGKDGKPIETLTQIIIQGVPGTDSPSTDS